MSYSRQNPSPRYIKLLEIYKEIHKSNLYQGYSITPSIYLIKKVIKNTGSRTLLDYGSGKGVQYKDKYLKRTLQEHWGVDSITCYDPGYPELEKLPEGVFDGVICTEVLEHIPEEDISWVLNEIFSYATRFVYTSVACYSACKMLLDGTNLHCTVKSPLWWKEQFEKIEAIHPDIYWEVFCTMKIQGKKSNVIIKKSSPET